MKNPNFSIFRKTSFITLIAVYFLILVGGIVRSTGSGMGCPDWPKCFGQWVPPTKLSQLPADYQNIYAQKRAKKNERFSGYLGVLGFNELADKIRNDKSLLVEAEFNKFKTWTEYINRLVGALIGILIFATVITSWPHRKQHSGIFAWSVACFILVLFQGWIGSIVVSTNLLPWMVTVHMIIAMIIMFILIYLVYKVSIKEKSHHWNGSSKVLNTLFVIGIVLTFSQILLGTQVREAIDVIASKLAYLEREKWIEEIGITFLVHRSYSLLILGLHGFLIYYLYKKISIREGRFFYLMKWLLVVVLIEIASGTLMAYFAIPAFLQPIHLLTALVIIGIQFYMYLLVNNKPRLGTEKVISR